MKKAIVVLILTCLPSLVNAQGQDSDSVVSSVVAPGGKDVYYIKTLHGQDVAGNPKMDIEIGINGNRQFLILLTNQPSEDPQKNLTEFSNLALSPDGKSLYFQTAAWATSDAIHSMNLKTRKVSYVTDGELACVVLGGQYQGDLIVEQHKYFVQGGSYDNLWLYDPTGKKIGLVSEDTDASRVCPLLAE